MRKQIIGWGIALQLFNAFYYAMQEGPLFIAPSMLTAFLVMEMLEVWHSM